MSTSLQLQIGGVDLSQYATLENFSVQQNFGKQGDTMQILLYDEHPTNAPTFVPQPLQTIKLTDLGTGDILFAGLVTQPQFNYMSPNLTQWQVTCRDYTYYADNAIVTGDFVGQTADAIIKDMTVGSGITTTNVATGPSISHVRVNHLQLSTAWTKIAKLASQTIEYDWFVDYSGDLHFFNWTQVTPRTLYLTDDVTDFSVNAGHYSTQQFQYMWDGQNVRNRIVVRGANYTALTTDHYAGDGNSNAWPLTYPIDTSNPSFGLTVGGVAKAITIWTQGGDITPSTATSPFHAFQDPNSNWWLHVGTDPIPAPGAAINFTYRYLAPVVAQVDNVASQAQYSSLGNAGIFEMYIADTSLTTILAAQQRGQRELTQYSNVQERVTLTTTEDFGGHFRTGDVVIIKNQFVPDSANSNIAGINSKFLIVSNQIQQGAASNFRTYTMTGVRVA